MRRSAVLTVVALLAAVGAAAAAKPCPLELIPEDAAAGLAIRDLNDLKQKGDRLVADTELKLPVRPSDLFSMLYNFLGVNAGLDGDAAGAVIIANPQKAGLTLRDGFLDLVVVAAPFRDRDRMAANFGIKAGELKPDTMVKGQAPNLGKFFYAHGNHVFFGNNERAVAAVVQGKPLAAALTDLQRRPLQAADVVLHFNAPALGKEWQDAVQELDGDLAKKAGPGDVAAVREFTAALRDVRFAQAALRVDRGLRLNFQAVFPNEASASARKFLTTLEGGPGTADLTGLPDGPVLAAYAAQGDGTRNVAPARLLLDAILSIMGPSPWLPSATDRPTVLGVFAEVWKHLHGSRAAVYLNADERQQGLVSAVAILDTDDPARFLGELRQLARYADPAGLNLSPRGPRREDVAEVERLIRDLGARSFRVRESATTKLSLIGEPALPYLAKALASSDAEVRRRAKYLQDGIVETAAERRKEALTQNRIRHLRPTFAFASKAETREGQTIDVLVIKLSGADAAAVKQMQQLFGPDWDKVRLAVHGKQVIALLGSDTDRLQATLKNVREGRPGLAAAKGLAAPARTEDPGRKFEVHFSQEATLALTKAEDLRHRRVGKPPLTSITLAADPGRVQLTLWMPTAEVRALVKASGVNRMFGR
jgi:hypothetical protein